MSPTDAAIGTTAPTPESTNPSNLILNSASPETIFVARERENKAPG